MGFGFGTVVFLSPSLYFYLYSFLSLPYLFYWDMISCSPCSLQIHYVTRNNLELILLSAPKCWSQAVPFPYIHCVACSYRRTSGFLYLKLLLNGNSEVLSLGNGFEWGNYAVIDCPSQCLGEQVVSHTDCSATEACTLRQVTTSTLGMPHVYP